MKRAFYLCTFFLLITVLGAQAGVAVYQRAWRNSGLFGITFPDGQEYIGKVESVNSVSLQDYETSTFKVLEMVIDIEGSPLQLRIYHAEAVDPNDQLNTLTNRTGRVSPAPFPNRSAAPKGLEDLANKARQQVNEEIEETKMIKEYPVTTHAKTIEYKLKSRNDVIRLYREFKNRWIGSGDINVSSGGADEEEDDGGGTTEIGGGEEEDENLSDNNPVAGDDEEPESTDEAEERDYTLGATRFVVY